MKISDVSIRRPVFATMMILALLVLGLSSYIDLPVELFPNVDFPFVIVQTTYPGASAESVETEVTDKIEEAVNQIAGIRNIQSQSREGYSLTFVEFELSVDGAVASQDVREKVAGIRSDLPDDIDEPIVSQYDPDAEAIMSLAMASPRPPREITQLIDDKIKPRLESISGVGSVEVVGGHDREVSIGLNPDLMESRQVSVDEVRNSVMAANLEIPGGRVEEASREYLVRVMGKLKSPEDFKKIIVKNHDGVPIYLSDIAEVRDTIAEMRSLSRFDGQEAIGLEIIKQSGANVVQLANEVRKALVRLQEELPPDVHINVVNDNSIWINDSIDEILSNIQIGTLLAVIVMFLFLLDIRPTVLTGLSIPISIVATFTAMKFMGFSINFMTLLGLSLAVGMLIDDSIVVVENVYRHMQQGKKPLQAASDATQEIGLAVMASTFTIMVVFLPVAFMEGIVGRFFYQFGMTVTIAVGISLFVAFTLVPMLASRTRPPEEDPAKLDPKNAHGWWRQWLKIRNVLMVWNHAFDALKPAYTHLLAFSLRHRFLVSLVATAAFVLGIYTASTLPSEWMPAQDQGKVYVSVETPPGTTLRETSDRIAQMEAIVNKMPEVDGIYVSIGSGNREVTEGSMLILLKDASERNVTAQVLVDSLRDVLNRVPGVKLALATQPAEGGSSKPVELSIRGEDRDDLNRLAHQAQKILASIPGTADVDNSLQEGKPELQVAVNRDAADDLGLNVGSISGTIRTLVEGEEITRYKEGDKEHPVRIRLQEKYRSSNHDVERILINSSKDVPGVDNLLVPLGRVAKIESKSSIGEYLRYNRQPEVRVNANVKLGAAGGTISQLAMARIGEEMKLPAGYRIAPVGEEEIREESAVSMVKALVLAIVFIYLILASQYESFWDPLSIMFSLPLSLIGAFLILGLTGGSMSIVTQIGVIMLMGIVTKNAILLVDFIKQRREEGQNRTAAVLEAGPVRLRPILMTTLSTVFGMLPLALGLGAGAEMRAPMARAVIGGIISSTLLTLIVVPVVYTMIDDVFSFVFRRGTKAAAQSVGGTLAENPAGGTTPE